MEAEEAFSKIAARMVEGLMFHDQMANYYAFLGFKGFQKEQEFHFVGESLSYRRLCRYFIRHYNRLVPEAAIENPSAIPSGWQKYQGQDVDSSTRRKSISDGFSKWVEWERGTKAIYEECASSLYSGGLVAGAIAIEKLVQDVDKELAIADGERLDLEAAGYDLPTIIEMQDVFRKKYGKRMKGLVK